MKLESSQGSKRLRGCLNWWGVAALALLSGCASIGGETQPGQSDSSERAISSALTYPQEIQPLRAGSPDAATQGNLPDSPDRSLAKVQLYPGSGQFLNRGAAQGRAASADGAGNITLNFESADLREVIKFVLSDLLGHNYLIDPSVQGQVTLQTTRPLAQDALLPTLETVLRMNGAVLLDEAGTYRVMPLEGALRGNLSPRLGRGGNPGYEVRIAPLRYIGVQEMSKILEPFLPVGGLVRIDPARNLMILAGTQRELAQIQETIDIFDVDWLKGMSVGLFTLDSVEISTIISELEQLFGESSNSPLAGLFRFVPLERLNAILVITPQPRYLKEADQWIKRLDRSTDINSQRLYVYRMQYGRAEDIAGVLDSVFGSSGTKKVATTSSRDASVAPGLQAAEIGSTTGNTDAPKARVVASVARKAGSGVGSSSVDNIEATIIADEANNALLIKTAPGNYKIIESAIKQLDIAPLQVLVDATILEVSLTGELQYGLQWFFNNRIDGYEGTGIQGDSSALPASILPGFSYSLVNNAGAVRAVLNLLESDDKIRVISSPSVMVLDNQSAAIRVGDQVPIRTSVTSRIDTDTDVSTASIAYRDTGVSLNVKPRVNAGGMVIMEIEQELDEASTTDSSTIDSPTIQQRRIQSVIAVQSGETIVLGGLIRETTSEGKSGVPGLYKLPVVGSLFGSTTESTRRTELIVLITPRVAHDPSEARQITNEFRNKLQGIPLFENGSLAPVDGTNVPAGG